MAESSSKEQARSNSDAAPLTSDASSLGSSAVGDAVEPRLVPTPLGDERRASSPSLNASTPRSLPRPRRFLLGPSRSGRRDLVTGPLALALFVAALVVVAVARGVLMRTLLPVALALAGIALVLRARRSRREALSRRARADEHARPARPDARSGVDPAVDAAAGEASSGNPGVLSLKSRRPQPSSTAGLPRRFEGVDAPAPEAKGGASRLWSEDGEARPDALAPPREPSVSPERCLEIDDRALALANGLSRTALLEFGTPFGMTLLSNRQRDRVVLALTSKGGSFLVGGRVTTADRRSVLRLLSRATVISTDEVAFDAIGPDGVAIELSALDLSALFESLDDVDPAATDRLLLSDTTGAPLELDGENLVVRGMLFDLTRPLEWKPLLFQESFGQSLALYQGTWIRQGSSEVVLVSLLPPSVLDPNPLDFEGAGIPDLDVRAMRDQRLMQATAGTPPPNDLRVAIDGIFMLPLRVALDQAPRTSVIPASVRPA